MKKITAILSITAIVLLCCSVQRQNSFQYEMRNLILEGNFIDSGNGSGSQRISVVIGITGEPYGFVKTSTFNVGLKTSESIDANKLILRQKALEFINENYPDN